MAYGCWSKSPVLYTLRALWWLESEALASKAITVAKASNLIVFKRVYWNYLSRQLIKH